MSLPNLRKTGLSAGLALCVAFQAVAAEKAFNPDDPEMKLKLPAGVVVAVDADKLGPAPDYLMTVGFVYQLDPHSVRDPERDKKLPPHERAMQEKIREARIKMATSTDATMIAAITDHLQKNHNLSEKQIENLRLKCIEILKARETKPAPAPP